MRSVHVHNFVHLCRIIEKKKWKHCGESANADFCFCLYSKYIWNYFVKTMQNIDYNTENIKGLFHNTIFFFHIMTFTSKHCHWEVWHQAAANINNQYNNYLQYFHAKCLLGNRKAWEKKAQTYVNQVSHQQQTVWSVTTLRKNNNFDRNFQQQLHKLVSWLSEALTYQI